MHERNGVHCSAPALNLPSSDDPVRGPIAALDEHIRLQTQNELERRVLVEPRHEACGLQRSHDRAAVGKRIDGTVYAFSEPADRIIRIESNDEACAQ